MSRTFRQTHHDTQSQIFFSAFQNTAENNKKK